MVGMNSVVMDHAVVGENAIVGAMAFVKTAQEIPANHLAVGTPARILRELSDQELQWKKEGTEVYQWLAMKKPELLKAVDAPLAEPESDRQRLQMTEYDSLHLRRFKADRK